MRNHKGKIMSKREYWQKVYEWQQKERAAEQAKAAEQTGHIQFASNPYSVNEQQMFQSEKTGEMNRRLVEVDQQEALRTGDINKASKYIAAEWNTPAVPTPEDALLYKARQKQIQDWETGYYKYANDKPFAAAYAYYKQKGYTDLSKVGEDKEASKSFFNIADPEARKDFFNLLKEDYEITNLQKQGLNNRRFQLGLQAAAGDPVTLSKVLDGDTYDVIDQQGKTKRVRAIGFDAFETFDNDDDRFMKQYLGVDITPTEARKRGQQTKADMKALIGQTIYLGGNPEGQEKDGFDRYLNAVFLPNGQNVADKYRGTDYDAKTATSPFQKVLSKIREEGIVQRTKNAKGEDILSIPKDKGKAFSEYYKQLVQMDVTLEEQQQHEARGTIGKFGDFMADLFGGSREDIDTFTRETLATEPAAADFAKSVGVDVEGVWRAGMHFVFSDMLPLLADIVPAVAHAVIDPINAGEHIGKMFEPSQASMAKAQRQASLSKLTNLMISAPGYKEDSGGLPYLDEGYEFNLTSASKGLISVRKHGEDEWLSPAAYGHDHLQMAAMDMTDGQSGDYDNPDRSNKALSAGYEDGAVGENILKLVLTGLTKSAALVPTLLNPYAGDAQRYDPMAFAGGVEDVAIGDNVATSTDTNWYMRNGALVSLVGEMGTSFALAGSWAKSARTLVDDMPSYLARFSRANKAAQKIAKFSPRAGEILSGAEKTYEGMRKLAKATTKVEKATALENLSRLQKFGAWYGKTTGDLGEGALTFAFAKYLSENGQISDDELMEAAESGAIYRGVGDAVGHAFSMVGKKLVKAGLGRFSIRPDQFANQVLGKAGSIEMSTLDALTYKAVYAGAQGPAGVAQEMMSTLIDDDGYNKFKERFFADGRAAENWINAFMQGYVMMGIPMTRSTISRLVDPSKGVGVWNQAKTFEKGVQMLKNYASADKALSEYFNEGNPDIIRAQDILKRAEIKTAEVENMADVPEQEAIAGKPLSAEPANAADIVNQVGIENALSLDDGESISPINVTIESNDADKAIQQIAEVIAGKEVAPEAPVVEEAVVPNNEVLPVDDDVFLGVDVKSQSPPKKSKPSKPAKPKSTKTTKAKAIAELDTSKVEEAFKQENKPATKTSGKIAVDAMPVDQADTNNDSIFDDSKSAVKADLSLDEEVSLLNEKAKTIEDVDAVTTDDVGDKELAETDTQVPENATDADGKPADTKAEVTSETPIADYYDTVRLPVLTDDGVITFTNSELELLNVSMMLNQLKSDGNDLSKYRFFSQPKINGPMQWGMVGDGADSSNKVFLSAVPEHAHFLSTRTHELLHPYLKKYLTSLSDEDVNEAVNDLRESFADLELSLKKRGGKLASDQRYLLEEMLTTINGWRLSTDKFTSVTDIISNPLRIVGPGSLQRFENKLKSVAKIVDFKQRTGAHKASVDVEEMARNKIMIDKYTKTFKRILELEATAEQKELSKEQQDELATLQAAVPRLVDWSDSSMIRRSKSEKFVPQTMLLERIFNDIAREGVTVGESMIASGSQAVDAATKAYVQNLVTDTAGVLRNSFQILNAEQFRASTTETSNFSVEDRYDRADFEQLSMASLDQVERLMGVDRGVMVENVKSASGAWSTYSKFEKDIMKSLQTRYRQHKGLLQHVDEETGETVAALKKDSIIKSLKQRYQDLQKHVPYHGAEFTLRNGLLSIKRVEAGGITGTDIQRWSKTAPSFVPDATNFKQLTNFWRSTAKRTSGVTSQFFTALSEGTLRHVSHSSSFVPLHNRMGEVVTDADGFDVSMKDGVIQKAFAYDKSGNSRNESIYRMSKDGEYVPVSSSDIAFAMRKGSWNNGELFDISKLAISEFISNGSDLDLYKTEGFFESLFDTFATQVRSGNPNMLIPMMHGSNAMMVLDADLSNIINNPEGIDKTLAELESHFLREFMLNSGEIDVTLPPEIDNSAGELNNALDFITMEKMPLEDPSAPTKMIAKLSDKALAILTNENGKKLQPFFDELKREVNDYLANEMRHIASGLETVNRDTFIGQTKTPAKAYNRYVMAKLLSLADAAQSLALNPAADWIAPYKHDKESGIYKWDKLHQKYSKALLRGNNIVDVDKLKDLYPERVVNGQFQAPKGMNIVLDKNGKRQLAMKTLVFDPDAYKAEFGEHHPLFRVFGPHLLDGGSILIEPAAVQFVNEIHGGSSTGAIKSEYRALTENGALHIKHAEHALIQDDFDAPTDPELHAFINALRDQGITMLTPTSATKMKGDRMPRRMKAQSLGKDLAVGMRGNIVGEYDAQGQVKPLKVGGTPEGGGKTLDWLLFDDVGRPNIPLADGIGTLDIMVTGDDGMKYMAAKKALHGDASTTPITTIPGFFADSEYWSPEAAKVMDTITERAASEFSSALNTLDFLGTQLSSKRLAGLTSTGEEAQTHGRHLMNIVHIMDSKLSAINSLTEMPSDAEMRAAAKIKEIVSERIDKNEAGSKKVYSVDFAKLASFLLNENAIFSNPKDKQLLPRPEFHAGVGTAYFGYLKTLADQTVMTRMPGKNMVYAPVTNAVGGFFRLVAKDMQSRGMKAETAKEIALELAQVLPLAKKQVMTEIDPLTGSKKTVYGDFVYQEEDVEARLLTLSPEARAAVTGLENTKVLVRTAHGFEIDGIDLDTNNYSKGSKAMMLSADWFDKHQDKEVGGTFNRRALSYVTPADNISSILTFNVRGLHAEGQANRVSYAADIAMGLQGKDMDIDTLSVATYDNKRVTKEEFDIMYDTLDKARGKMLSSKKLTQSFRDYGKKFAQQDMLSVKLPYSDQSTEVPRAWFMQRKNIDKWAADNNIAPENVSKYYMAYEEMPFGGESLPNGEISFGNLPLNAGFFKHNRMHTGNTPISMAAWTGNQIASFYQRHPQGFGELMLPMLIEEAGEVVSFSDPAKNNGKAFKEMVQGAKISHLKINFDYDAERLSFHLAMAKEGAVDLFNHLGFVPDHIEMAAHIMVKDYALFSDTERRVIKAAIKTVLEQQGTPIDHVKGNKINGKWDKYDVFLPKDKDYQLERVFVDAFSESMLAVGEQGNAKFMRQKADRGVLAKEDIDYRKMYLHKRDAVVENIDGVRQMVLARTGNTPRDKASGVLAEAVRKLSSKEKNLQALAIARNEHLATLHDYMLDSEFADLAAFDGLNQTDADGIPLINSMKRNLSNILTTAIFQADPYLYKPYIIADGSMRMPAANALRSLAKASMIDKRAWIAGISQARIDGEGFAAPYDLTFSNYNADSAVQLHDNNKHFMQPITGVRKQGTLSVQKVVFSDVRRVPAIVNGVEQLKQVQDQYTIALFVDKVAENEDGIQSQTFKMGIRKLNGEVLKDTVVDVFDYIENGFDSNQALKDFAEAHLGNTPFLQGVQSMDNLDAWLLSNLMVETREGALPGKVGIPRFYKPINDNSKSDVFAKTVLNYAESEAARNGFTPDVTTGALLLSNFELAEYSTIKSTADIGKASGKANENKESFTVADANAMRKTISSTARKMSLNEIKGEQYAYEHKKNDLTVALGLEKNAGKLFKLPNPLIPLAFGDQGATIMAEALRRGIVPKSGGNDVGKMVDFLSTGASSLGSSNDAFSTSTSQVLGNVATFVDRRLHSGVSNLAKVAKGEYRKTRRLLEAQLSAAGKTWQDMTNGNASEVIFDTLAKIYLDSTDATPYNREQFKKDMALATKDKANRDNVMQRMAMDIVSTMSGSSYTSYVNDVQQFNDGASTIKNATQGYLVALGDAAMQLKQKRKETTKLRYFVKRMLGDDSVLALTTMDTMVDFYNGEDTVVDLIDIGWDSSKNRAHQLNVGPKASILNIALGKTQDSIGDKYKPVVMSLSTRHALAATFFADYNKNEIGKLKSLSNRLFDSVLLKGQATVKAGSLEKVVRAASAIHSIMGELLGADNLVVRHDIKDGKFFNTLVYSPDAIPETVEARFEDSSYDNIDLMAENMINKSDKILQRLRKLTGDNNLSIAEAKEAIKITLKNKLLVSGHMQMTARKMLETLLKQRHKLVDRKLDHDAHLYDANLRDLEQFVNDTHLDPVNPFYTQALHNNPFRRLSDSAAKLAVNSLADRLIEHIGKFGDSYYETLDSKKERRAYHRMLRMFDLTAKTSTSKEGAIALLNEVKKRNEMRKNSDHSLTNRTARGSSLYGNSFLVDFLPPDLQGFGGSVDKMALENVFNGLEKSFNRIFAHGAEALYFDEARSRAVLGFDNNQIISKEMGGFFARMRGDKFEYSIDVLPAAYGSHELATPLHIRYSPTGEQANEFGGVSIAGHFLGQRGQNIYILDNNRVKEIPLKEINSMHKGETLFASLSLLQNSLKKAMGSVANNAGMQANKWISLPDPTHDISFVAAKVMQKIPSMTVASQYLGAGILLAGGATVLGGLTAAVVGGGALASAALATTVGRVVTKSADHFTRLYVNNYVSGYREAAMMLGFDVFKSKVGIDQLASEMQLTGGGDYISDSAPELAYFDMYGDPLSIGEQRLRIGNKVKELRSAADVMSAFDRFEKGKLSQKEVVEAMNVAKTLVDNKDYGDPKAIHTELKKRYMFDESLGLTDRDGYDLASAIATRSQLNKVMFNTFSGLARFVFRSEAASKATALGAAKFMRQRYAPEQSKASYDPVERAILESIAERTVGQYGGMSKLTKDTSPVGRLLKLYSRYHKRNFMYHFFDNWANVDKEQMLKEAETEHPELFAQDITAEHMPEYTKQAKNYYTFGTGYGLLMAGAFTELNSLIASMIGSLFSDDTDEGAWIASNPGVRSIGNDYLGVANGQAMLVSALYNTVMYGLSYNIASEESKMEALMSGKADIVSMVASEKILPRSMANVLTAGGSGQGPSTAMSGAISLLMHMHTYTQMDKGNSAPIYQALYDQKLTNSAGDLMRAMFKITPGVSIADQYAVDPFVTKYLQTKNAAEQEKASLLGTTDEYGSKNRYKSFKDVENDLGRQTLPSGDKLSPAVKDAAKKQQSGAKAQRKSIEDAEKLRKMFE